MASANMSAVRMCESGTWLTSVTCDFITVAGHSVLIETPAKGEIYFDKYSIKYLHEVSFLV